MQSGELLVSAAAAGGGGVEERSGWGQKEEGEVGSKQDHCQHRRWRLNKLFTFASNPGVIFIAESD